MADIKWIKITTDVFDDEKILLLESFPEADTLIVIWFKLLCLAGKQNNCGVFLVNDKIPYTDKMLATIFRRKESTVQLALKTFEEFGMIELIDGVITIPNWEKHQNIDGMEKVREQTRLRVAKHREKQRLLLGCNVTGNDTVTQGNGTEKERDKEEDIIINNKQNINNIHTYSSSSAQNELIETADLSDHSIKTQPDSHSTSAMKSKPNDEEDDFARFWKHYPKKADKQRARVAFGKALKSKKVTVDELIEAVEQQKKSRQWQDISYVPNPTTWLNGSRWEDVLPEANSNNNNNSGDKWARAAEAVRERSGLL